MGKTKSSATDKLVQDLFQVVQQKKEEISKLEKPTWETNCSFGYNVESSARINLHTVVDLNVLAGILGFLNTKEEELGKARTMLGLPSESFKWQGFTRDQWKADLETRIAKIQISSKRRELEILEERLNKLISPELRAQLELEEITKLLSV